jgi:hypothetical protein
MLATVLGWGHGVRKESCDCRFSLISTGLLSAVEEREEQGLLWITAGVIRLSEFHAGRAEIRRDDLEQTRFRISPSWDNGTG